MHLVGRDGASVSELGNQLGLNSAGATGLVARLERAGLVRRASSETDARAQRVHVTSKGRRVTSRVAPLLVGLARQMTSGFAARDVRVIRRFLEHVATAFEAAGAPVPTATPKARRTR